MGGLNLPTPAAGTQRRPSMTRAGAPCASCARSPSPASPPPRPSPRPPGPGRPGCAAASGSPTGACSPARCRPRGTGRSSSACCTPTPPSSSSSRPAPAAATARSRSTAAAAPEHYLPGGAERPTATGSRALLAHAERIVRRRLRAPARATGGPREEAFVGVAPRVRARGDKHAVAHTRFLWVDVDRPGRLPALWALLAERPCHLLIESGGSGGVHAYWKLAEPLPATRARPGDGRRGRADRAGAPAAHPRASASTSTASPTSPTRVQGALARDAPGRHGQLQDRRVRADRRGRPALPAYPLEELVGDLPDPRRRRPRRRGAARRTAARTRTSGSRRPSTSPRLAGITVPRRGLVSLPGAGPRGPRTRPAASAPTPAQGWCCHAGTLRGARRDLRPRLRARRRPVGARAARRGVHARPRARARGLRRRCDDGDRDGGRRPTRARRSPARALYVVRVVDARRRADRRPRRPRLHAARRSHARTRSRSPACCSAGRSTAQRRRRALDARGRSPAAAAPSRSSGQFVIKVFSSVTTR